MTDPSRLGTLKRLRAEHRGALPQPLRYLATLPDGVGRPLAAAYIAAVLPILLIVFVVMSMIEAAEEGWGEAMDVAADTVYRFGQLRGLKKAIAAEEAGMGGDA